MKRGINLSPMTIIAILMVIIGTILSFMAKEQDVSNIANNFYQSNQVTTQKVTFKN